METRRPRALRMRPMLAAVMPLPREEVTPPVTKTYFAMGRVLRGFFQCYPLGHAPSNRGDEADARGPGCRAARGTRRASPRFGVRLFYRLNGRDLRLPAVDAFDLVASIADGSLRDVSD